MSLNPKLNTIDSQAIKHFALLAVILIASSSILFQRFHSPFDRVDDTNSLIYAFYAKNMVRYPFSFHQLRNIDALTDEAKPTQFGISNLIPYTHYLDHSPLITILTAASFHLFGSQASSARLIPIFSSLGTLVIFFHLLKPKLKADQALLATFFLGTFSLFLEHGQILNFEPTTLFFIMLTYFLLNRYINSTKSKITLTLVFTIWYIAQLSDWPAAFAGPVISFMLYRHTQSKKLSFFAFFFAFAGAITVFLDYSLLNNNFFPNFFNSAVISPLSPSSIYKFNLSKFLKSQHHFNTINLTQVPMLATLVWIFSFVKKILLSLPKKFTPISISRSFTQIPITHPEKIAFWFLVIGLLNTVIFYSWAATHRFWMYYLLPFFAITATLGFVRLSKIKSVFKILLPILILIYSYQTTKNALKFIHNPAITQTNINGYKNLNEQIPNDQVIFTNKNIYTTGNGRRIRYYVDRPIYIAQSELEAHNPGFKGQYWLVSNNDQDFINSLSGEKVLLDPDFTLIKQL